MPERESDNVAKAFAAFTDAMLAADTAALRSLTAATFTLRHMTGYVQPLNDWLHEMEMGEFIYYSVEIRRTEITLRDAHAVLLARTVTDARVYGNRANWQLQLELQYRFEQDHWVAERALASVWR